MAAPKATLIDEGASSVPLQAWCYSCAAMTEMTRPGPVKTVNGVGIRHGTCGRCGQPTWRVGGWREEA